MDYLGVAQFGSVLEWGSRGRRFESSHPDVYFLMKIRKFFYTLPVQTVPSLFLACHVSVNVVKYLCFIFRKGSIRK